MNLFMITPTASGIQAARAPSGQERTCEEMLPQEIFLGFNLYTMLVLHYKTECMNQIK